jgi:GNAT superfamily N-acetyltransferase
MRIRKATPDDEESITEELLRPFYEMDEELDYSFNKLDQTALETAGCGYWIDAEDKTMIVSEHDDGLSGFISAVEVEEPPIYVRDTRIHIDGLYVKKQFRRQGIATMLIDRVADWATERGCDYLGVSAHVNNDASRGLYSDQFRLKFLSYRRRLE